MRVSVLERVARGEASAFESCVERYGGLVWSLARKSCSNESDAEDATQEIFADLWSNAERYDHKVASEATFIAMIARRRLIDRRRRDGRRPQPAALESATVESRGTSPEPLTEVKEEAERVLAAMRTLRPEVQKALQLAISEGMTHQDVAETMGRPLGTVKTYIRRGLIAVREVLGSPSQFAKEVDE